MIAVLKNGWIVVQIEVPERSRVEIAATGSRTTKAFKPAFRDYQGGVQVCMVRAPIQPGRYVISVRIDGVEQPAGTLTI